MCSTKQKIAKLNIRLISWKRNLTNLSVCFYSDYSQQKRLLPIIMQSIYKNKCGIKFHNAHVSLNKTLFGCHFLNSWRCESSGTLAVLIVWIKTDIPEARIVSPLSIKHLQGSFRNIPEGFNLHYAIVRILNHAYCIFVGYLCLALFHCFQPV
jgi:hypothetical protein